MTDGRVVVVGSANADLVLDVPHRPAAGETVLGSDLVTMPGGKGANQAAAAALLGADVAFVGCVGGDTRGELLRLALREVGAEVGALCTVDTPTGAALVLVTPDGENSIVVSPGANRDVTPERVDAGTGRWDESTVVVTQLEIPMETVEHVARLADRSGARLVLNAAPAQNVPLDVLRTCDPLVVNESEARAVLLSAAGSADAQREPDPDAVPPAAIEEHPDRAVAALLALGARSVVVTLGARGAVLAEGAGSEPVRVPAPDVTAVDTTGAGDAFVGALATELAAGRGLHDAVTLGTAVAAVAVQRRGAQGSFPRREELP